MYTIGIDLGTSAVKLLLMGDGGEIVRIASREYPIEFPRPGWSQQDPADWWEAVCAGIPELLEGLDASQVRGIGAGGQMHGLVALDENDAVIRPAILWNDGRTRKQVEYLNGVIGREKLSRYTANIAFAGFTAPKLLWMRENEPELFGRIRKIMLPKDYINYRLTGVHCTDFSDASGMLLLDVEHKRWSREMLDICGVTEAQLPRLYESWETVGTLLPEAAARLMELAEAEGAQVVLVEGTERLSLGEAELTLFPPLGGGTSNESGLFVLCTAGEFDVLITGDADAFVEKMLVKYQPIPDIEVLAAGHHGSKHSSCGEFLQAVAPEIALISAGANNSYGHPAQETLERLEELGAEIHRTDREGTVTVRVKDGRVGIH